MLKLAQALLKLLATCLKDGILKLSMIMKHNYFWPKWSLMMMTLKTKSK